MSKESIPIGSLCLECDRYSTCRTLCPYAEQYVSQDSIPQREQILANMEATFAMNGKDYKDILHTRMRDIERGNRLTVKKRAMLSMHLGNVPIKEIAQCYQCSTQYVGKVIAEFQK